MQASIPGVVGPLKSEQFTGGQSNPTYLVRTPGRNFVLRRKPGGKLLPSAHAVEREFRVLRALETSDVPIARVYALCEDSEVIGSPFGARRGCRRSAGDAAGPRKNRGDPMKGIRCNYSI